MICLAELCKAAWFILFLVVCKMFQITWLAGCALLSMYASLFLFRTVPISSSGKEGL